ncbi:MAG: YggT family protein [Sphingomicrobium sp.]
MVTLIGLLQIVLDVLWWVIVIQVVISWLLAFKVLNAGSGAVRSFIVGLDRLTAPLYRPIRRILPDFGGLDFSPLVILLAVSLLESRVLEPIKLSYQFAG